MKTCDKIEQTLYELKVEAVFLQSLLNECDKKFENGSIIDKGTNIIPTGESKSERL